jgi:hypothetical protein
VRLPPNHTSTGYVTSAVTLSVMTAPGGMRTRGPLSCSFTASTTGEGIWPFCRTVTVVRDPRVLKSAIEPSTLSVANSHEYQNHDRSCPNARLMKNM